MGISDFDVLLAHQSESDHREEDELVLLEQSSRYPLVNSESNVLNELGRTCFISFWGLFDSLEEEFNEALQRVLIHMIDDAEGDTKEVEHSTFSSDRTIDFSLSIDIDFCKFSDL